MAYLITLKFPWVFLLLLDMAMKYNNLSAPEFAMSSRKAVSEMFTRDETWKMEVLQVVISTRLSEWL